MKRIFDFVLSLLLLLLLLLPMFVVAAVIKISSPGPALFWTDRIGKNNRIFRMAKFRTMRCDTPQIATHLMSNPQDYLIPCGRFLRQCSIDEWPQLLNIFKGDMSFIGPRPALFNQDDLRILRTSQMIHELVPGITGWAQIHGRDNLSIPEKVSLDRFYYENRSLLLDLRIFFLTILKVIKREGVQH